MTTRRRISIVFVVVVSSCGAYLWFFGVPTIFAIESRYIGWKMPIVKRIPIRLADLSASPASGRTLSYFGYQFEVPWTDLDEQKTKQVGRMQLIVFRSGKTVLFSTKEPRELVNTFLSSANSDTGPSILQKLYGEEALRSDYSLHRIILEATPGKVGIFSGREQAVGNAMLLITKGIIIPAGGESGIFQVTTGSWRGFQYGDPQKRPRSVDIELFADDGGLGFIFSRRPSGPMTTITQAEINRVIQTAKKVTVQARAAEADSRTR